MVHLIVGHPDQSCTALGVEKKPTPPTVKPRSAPQARRIRMSTISRQATPPQDPHAGDELLTIAEVADVVRVPVATLRYWRHLGTGPHSFRTVSYTHLTLP